MRREAKASVLKRLKAQPTGGSVAPRSPMRFSVTETARDRPLPRLGEHGDAIGAALAAGADGRQRRRISR